MFRNVKAEEKKQLLLDLELTGYSHLKGYIPENTLATLKGLVEEIHNREKEYDYQGRPDRDVDDQVVYNLQNKDKYFIDILGDSFLEDVLMEKLNDRHYRFLPPDAQNYILKYYNARLDLHIDSYVPSTGNYTWSMQVVFVLDDFTEENGGTLLPSVKNYHSG